MKLSHQIGAIITSLILLSCEETCCQIEYTQLALGDQIPYLLQKYELRNNGVLTVEKTEYNSYNDPSVLNRYSTSYSTFRQGYLEHFSEEKLNGDRYSLMETTSVWNEKRFRPLVYTYHRNEQLQYRDSLVYDREMRLVQGHSLSGILDLSYDSDNKLVEKSFTRNGSKQWTTKYLYDGRELEREEFYMHKTGEPVMSLMSRFRESEIIQYRIKNGEEELDRTITVNKNGDPLITKGKYGVIRDLSYEYDERGNWVLRVDKSEDGQYYATHREITYEDGAITGDEWTPEKIAEKLNLTYDKRAYDAYLAELDYKRPKS